MGRPAAGFALVLDVRRQLEALLVRLGPSCGVSLESSATHRKLVQVESELRSPWHRLLSQVHARSRDYARTKDTWGLALRASIDRVSGLLDRSGRLAADLEADWNRLQEEMKAGALGESFWIAELAGQLTALSNRLNAVVPWPVEIRQAVHHAFRSGNIDQAGGEIERYLANLPAGAFRAVLAEARSHVLSSIRASAPTALDGLWKDARLEHEELLAKARGAERTCRTRAQLSAATTAFGQAIRFEEDRRAFRSRLDALIERADLLLSSDEEDLRELGNPPGLALQRRELKDTRTRLNPEMVGFVSAVVDHYGASLTYSDEVRWRLVDARLRRAIAGDLRRAAKLSPNNDLLTALSREFEEVPPRDRVEWGRAMVALCEETRAVQERS